MEAANRTRSRTRRNPLSDRTNLPSSTVPFKPTKPNPLPLSSSSSTSSSAFNKPPTKRASTTRAPTNLDAASNPSSPPRPVLSTPLVKSSSLFGTVDLEASPPITITYSRSNKRKDREEAVAIPVSTPDLNVSNSRKDKGKAVGIPVSTPDLNVSNSRKDKGKALAIPVTHTPDLTVSNSRKDKGKAVAIPISRTPDLRVSYNREGVNLSKSKKAWTVPCRKKQRSEPSDQDMFKDPQLQEFIAKQKAYFKAIDDFELPEEEVESVDELD